MERNTRNSSIVLSAHQKVDLLTLSLTSMDKTRRMGLDPTKKKTLIGLTSHFLLCLFGGGRFRPLFNSFLVTNIISFSLLCCFLFLPIFFLNLEGKLSS